LADFSATARLIAEPQRQHAGSAPRRDPELIGVKRRRKLSSIRYRCGDKVNGVAARLAMPIPCSSIAIEVPAPFGERDDDLRSWPRDTIISGICGARKRFNRPTRANAFAALIAVMFLAAVLVIGWLLSAAPRAYGSAGVERVNAEEANEAERMTVGAASSSERAGNN
jgi:hypothetical protein